jgi:anti-sigma factor RsiW
VLLARHVADQALVARMDRVYEDGLVGSRDPASRPPNGRRYRALILAVDSQPQPSTADLRLARSRAFR